MDDNNNNSSNNIDNNNNNNKVQFVVKFSWLNFLFMFCPCLGESTHDDNNPSATLDKMTKDFLEKMHKEGRLDNAVLILMSDHGARFANTRYP